jgi:hypothetical protein
MKPKSLLLAGLLVGFAAGVLWQRSAINKLDSELQQLREKNKEMDELRAENERLSQEKIDPAELQRLRDAQSELLRLRAQVSQLKRDAQEAKAASASLAAAQQPAATGEKPETGDLPVLTYIANVNARVGWGQALVAGGWKLPDGKRALVFVQAEPGGDGNQVTVRTRFVDLPENLLSAMGFDKLRTDNRLSADSVVYSAEQAASLFKTLEQTDGVDVLSAPSVTTLSGRQAQVSVTQDHQTASGERYRTGPTVDVIPNVAADGQTIEMIVSAQLNQPKLNSSQ